MKAGLERSGCQPTQARMSPDVYWALCDELGVPGDKSLSEFIGMRVKASRNLRRGTVVIEEDARAMHKRMKAEAQKGREDV